MSFLRQIIKSGAALFAAAVFMTAGDARAVVLPAPNCGFGPTNNCIVFDDVTVFSLALLNFQAGFGAIQPGDPFYVKSNGNEIANALVIGSSDSNAVKNQHLAIGNVDNAYFFPSNIPANQAVNYLMNPAASGTGDGAQADPGNPLNNNPDPAIGFTGDNIRQAGTTVNNPNTQPASSNGSLPLWDVSIGALQNFLGSGNLVFFFNLNEENGGTLDQGQDMLAYADVYLTDFGPDGQPGGGDDIVMKFTLSGNACNGGPLGSCPTTPPFQQAQAQTSNVDDILPSANDSWAYVHGQICVSDAGAVVNLGPCAQGDNDPTHHTVNQNLGSDQAAFALYNAQLDAAVHGGTWDIMSVDVRMGHLGNGFEQLFILSATVGQVPEPTTISILGLGLVGLALMRRRRRT